MQRIKFGRLALWVSLGTFTIGIPALAQNASGSIVGHVSDTFGAAVIGAQVSVMNVDTHDVRTVSTNQAGDYTVPVLQPGHYQVEVREKGFESEMHTGIVLDVDQTVRINTALTVGSSTQSVTVNATALSLDTDSAAVGQTISGEEISQLPLNGRNFQDLMLLAPGAVNNAGGEQTSYRIDISGTGISSVSLGGSRGSSEGYTVDGTSILDIGYDTPMFPPSLDDIAEFDLLTKSYSAQYGYSMNQINLISKSGTNNYHGSLFEFLRNNAVDALPHGANYGGATAESVLQQNQFGYSLGGPVRIPWLYNGRNKTFFFANYEGYRLKKGGSGSTVVPTADEMNGKFDANVLGTLTAPLTRCGVTYSAGAPRPLFNPLDPSGQDCPFTAAADGSYTIPSGLISHLGAVVMTPGIYYPKGPNLNVPLGQPNYAYSAASTLNYNQQNYRIDQNIGAKDLIYFHMTWHDENEAVGADAAANETVTTQPGRLYTGTETHLFSPNFTNQVRLGFSEGHWTSGPATTISPEQVAALNWPNPFHSLGEGYPEIQFDTTAGTLYDGLTYGGTQASVSSTSSELTSVWDYGESAIWTIKRHTLSFGFGGRHSIYNTTAGGSLGRINYNGQYSGDNFADSLLGASPQIDINEVGPTGNPNQGPESHIYFNWYSPYVQDDWKVTDRLTLNLGLRYEFIATPFEGQNNFMWPDFSAPGGAIYVANAKTVTTYGGVNPFSPSTALLVNPPGGERGPGPAPKNDFAPRLGFAYRLFGDGKTVVRGGFGKYFDTIEYNELQQSYFNPGIASGYANGSDAGFTPIPLFNTNSLPTSATASGPVASCYAGGGCSFGFNVIQGAHFLNPYYLAWNLGVQRELPGANVLEVDYIGNHGTNLYGRTEPNAPVQCIPQYGCTFTGTGFNAVATVPVENRVPYQNLGVLINAQFNGFSNYNALDMKVEHRSGNLDLVAAYTWSKELDTKSGVAGFNGAGQYDTGWFGPQDGHDVASDYARGSYDVGNRLAVTAVYALPFGRGKAILGNSSRVVDETIGGWKIGVLSSFQGGIPITIYSTDINSANNALAERANFNPGAPKCPRSHAQYFCYDSTPGSTDAMFTQPAPGYYGNSSRDAIRVPGQINADLSLSKSFSIVETSSFELRFDSFNAFNHWNPGQPVDSAVGPTLSYTAPGQPVTEGQILPNNTQGCNGSTPGCSAARILQLSGRFTF